MANGTDSDRDDSPNTQSQSATKKSWRDSKAGRSLSAVGSSLSSSGSQMMSDARDEAASRIGPVSYKRGGKIRKPKRKAKSRAKMRV